MRSRGTSASGRRVRPFPKGVWFASKRLASGKVVRYGYYGRGKGAVPLGREGSVEFAIKLGETLRKEPDQGTVANLIWRYKQSPELAKVSPRTKDDYRGLLDKIQAQFGPLTLRAMADRAIAQHIYEWRDSMAKSPRRADYAVQVLKVLLSWGKKRGLIEQNRAEGIGRLHSGDRRNSVWSDEQIAAFRAVASEPLRRALVLAIETGQRQGDLLALRWSAVGSNIISLTQSKTGARVAVPISNELRETLDGLSRSADDHILSTAAGAPWDSKGNGFRSAWRDACKAAGVVGVTFHDLRGTFVTRRLAAGWTAQEVALCTGHSLRDLAMLDTYADRSTVAAASAERISQRA
ncbi:tyrosine-type recombinase/integrase [Phenylobacterium sp.]|uniref:tyrosine-type recombinase/integrase n=1 Tax=Phenylobacterium sp. TaxID=1871053 RepID=UPI002C207564|nr:tyrosine-type recombinase/integrase [Phenylobacterium sp.]HLZ77126.1 tyrosine-type recombinase/integrase [Phenylobacterium sp.]